MSTLPHLDERGMLDPNMPAAELRLHMGELSADEIFLVRSAIAWANRVACSEQTERPLLSDVSDASLG